MRNPSQNSIPSELNAPAAALSERFYAALSDIGQLLVRSLEPAVLYEGVIEVLERRVGARLVMVGEVDHGTGWFQRMAPAQIPAGLEDIYPERLPLTLAHPSFWRGLPQLEADIRCTPGLEMFRTVYERHRVAAVVAVPVMKFGEVRAALVIRASHADFLSPSMIELLQQAATSIGLGLEAHEQRTLLLQSVQEEARQRRALRLLSEMVKVITRSADEAALLADACAVVHRVGGYRLARVSRLDDATGQAGRGESQAGLADAPGSGPTPAAAIEAALATALRDGVPEVRRAPWPVGAAIPEPALQAMLTLPLRVDGAVVAALVIGAIDADAFAPVEVQVFAEMATELGLGMQMQRSRAARLQAEHALQYNLEHFRTILANQQSGILVVAEDNTVKFANEAFCRLFGFKESPAELENQPAAAIHARLQQAYGDPEREFRRLRTLLADGVAVRGDEVVMSDGRIFVRDFTPIRINGVAQGRIWNQRDITEQKMHEASVERLAFYDVVTGLPNRRLLFELLEQARSSAVRQQSLLAVGVLDLDRFKSINDSVGHDGGDRVLAEASTRILAILRKEDVLARFGGDEFALVIAGLDSREQLEVICRCILQALRAPFELMGEQVHLSASIGWTLFPLDNSDAEGLVRHADLAMYVAKEEGKDRGAVYEPALELVQHRLQAMRERIGQALVQSQLRLLYQPIVYIDGLPGLHGVAGMEALVRLQDAELGLIEPASFMHVLDDPQLARPIGRYVLDEALRQCQAWMQQGVSLPVSINISTRHLLHPLFFSDIDAALEAYPGVMDVGFGIEVTETGPSMDHARAKVVIEECRRRGIRVGLDDFGTGSASLSHIQKLDIEHIKLDQSFVRDILSDERNMAIAAGVITTARMLAKAVIAEGVENSAQGDLLASLGCHQLQGFSISRPMQGDAVVGWVARWVPPVSWGQLVSERQSLLSGQSGHA